MDGGEGCDGGGIMEGEGLLLGGGIVFIREGFGDALVAIGGEGVAPIGGPAAGPPRFEPPSGIFLGMDMGGGGNGFDTAPSSSAFLSTHFFNSLS